MRRSTRDKKTPEFFKPPESAGAGRLGAIHEGSDDEEEDERTNGVGRGRGRGGRNDEDEAEDYEEEGNSRGRSKAGAKLARGVAAPKGVDTSTVSGATAAGASVARPGPSARSRAAASAESFLSYPGQKCRVFDAMITGKDIANETRALVALFPRNHIAAVTEVANFVLIAGGAGRKWIGSKVELEGLEPQELDELLRDLVEHLTSSATATAATTPLNAVPSGRKGGAGGAMRSNYHRIWQEFVDNVNSPLIGEIRRAGQVESNPLDSTLEVLEMVVNVLISLSSFGVASIRDAVTEAVLSIGQAVLRVVVESRSKLETSRRQLRAEESKSRASKQTSKYQSIEALVAQQESTVDEFTRLSGTIFNAVFAHRYKDSNEAIRAHTCARLGQWLLQDPARLFEDTYLKYIGWMCSDRSPAVRLEAVTAISNLCEARDFVRQMEGFFDRFMARLIEIAAGDLNDKVALAAISCLRKTQKLGFLDEVDLSSLNSVDGVVFNAEVGVETRAEALQFMMDHTQGFEFLENPQAPSATASKNRKGQTGKDDSDSNLARRRDAMLAVETLIEFIDDHAKLGSASSIARGGDSGVYHVTAVVGSMTDMLVEAIEELSDAHAELIHNWDAMVTLLLRESDASVSAQALQVRHATILLQFMYSSATAIQRKQPVNSKELSELKAVLNKNFSRVLLRFQDSEENLFTVISFLEFCDLQKNSKMLDETAKSLIELMAKFQSESFLQKLATSLRLVIDTCGSDKSAKNRVLSHVSAFLESVWSKMTDGAAVIKDILEGSKNKKRKSGSGESKTDDAIFSACSAVEKFAILYRAIDCRELINIENTVDTLVVIARSGFQLAQSFYATGRDLNKLVSVVFSGAKFASHAMYNIMLWCTRDIFSPDVSKDSKVEIAESVAKIRHKLVDVLQSWMESDEDFEESSMLKVEAFRIIGDLRVLFAASQHTDAFEGLSWQPSQEVLKSMRAVFDEEVASFRDRITSAEDNTSEHAQNDDISLKLAENLFYPLGQVMLYDASNLNRRQAAAILSFMADSQPRIQEVVKVWAKKLKEIDFVKYLEIQLVTLRTVFTDRVLKHLSVLRDADNVASATNYTTDDIEELDEKLDQGYQYLHLLAQKISQTLGVGKLKGDHAIALSKLFITGLDFAFTDVAALSFLSALEPYFRFLPTPQIDDVRAHLESLLDSPTTPHELLDLLNENPKTAPARLWSTRGLKAYASFEGMLSGKKSQVRSEMFGDISDISHSVSLISKPKAPAQRAIVPPSRRPPAVVRESISAASSSSAKGYGTNPARDRSYSESSMSLEEFVKIPTRPSASSAIGRQSGASRTSAVVSPPRTSKGKRSAGFLAFSGEESEEEVMPAKRQRQSGQRQAGRASLGRVSSSSTEELKPRPSSRSGSGIMMGLHLEDLNDDAAQESEEETTRPSRTAKTAATSRGKSQPEKESKLPKSALLSGKMSSASQASTASSRSNDDFSALRSTRNRNR